MSDGMLVTSNMHYELTYCDPSLQDLVCSSTQWMHITVFIFVNTMNFDRNRTGILYMINNLSDIRMFTHLSESSRHDSVNFKQKNNENCYLYWRKSYCEIWCVVFMPPRSKIGGILFSSFCPSLWNFKLANNIWTMNARALIFHMNIPCDKTFPWITLFFTLWP